MFSILIWLLHLACVFFMTGVIWVIQLVHYPLMERVGRSEFGEYHREHSRRISWVVGPVMALELASAALLVWRRPIGVSEEAVWGCVALSVLVFLATGGLSVPCHNRLARGFEPAAHQRLVSTNWVRTLAWTVHAALVIGVTANFLVL